MKRLSDYKDQMGFIGHFRDAERSSLEFGDGTQRLGMLRLADYFFWLQATSDRLDKDSYFNQIRVLFLTQLRSISKEDGEWVRHWTTNIGLGRQVL